MYGFFTSYVILNPFFIDFCDRLARAGFVVLAPDLYNGVIAESIEEAERLRNACDADFAGVQAWVLQSLETLREHPAVQGNTVGTVGFSMGAYWSLVLSTQRPQDIAAVVVFYGVGPADFTTSRAAYLGHFGEEDTWEPLDPVRQVEQEIRDAGNDVTFHVYPGAGHWFFESDRPDAFHPQHAETAWNRTVAFLKDRPMRFKIAPPTLPRADT